MPLQAVVDSLDSVDEKYQGLYVEQDGKYVVDIAPSAGFELADVSGLKGALGKERKRADKAESTLKKWGDKNPDDVEAALSKLEELNSFDPNKEAEKIAEQKLRSREEQLLKKHAEQVSGFEGKVHNLTSQLENVLVKSAAVEAISKEKGSVDLLLPHVRNSIRVSISDEGSFNYEVVDGMGNPRIGDTKGTPMTIHQLVQEMKSSDTFAVAFQGSGRSGGGMPPQVTGAGGKGSQSLSAVDKIASGLGSR